MLYRCLAVVCLFASTAANAVDPRFYQLGDGGAVAPHVRLEFGNDNNPLRGSDGSQESMYFRLQPSLRYLVQARNNRLQLSYLGDYTQYFQEYCQGSSFNQLARPGDCLSGSPTFNTASYQDHTLSLNGFLEISSRLRATLTASHVIAHQPAGTGQSGSRGVLDGLTSPDAWIRQSARAEVSYGAAKARGEVRAGLTLGNREFDSSRNVPASTIDGLSEQSVAPNVMVLYRIGTRTQLFAGIGSSQVRGGNSERNISFQSFGVEFDSSAITSGSIRINNSSEDFINDQRTDLDYLGWEVELTWRPRRYSTFTVGGGKQSENGAFGRGLGLTSKVNAEWVHDWRERFSTRMELQVALNEDVGVFSENNGSDENPVSFRVEGNYNIRRWLDIGAFVVIDSRTGETLTRERDLDTGQYTGAVLETESRKFGRTLIGVTMNGTI